MNMENIEKVIKTYVSNLIQIICMGLYEKIMDKSVSEELLKAVVSYVA